MIKESTTSIEHGTFEKAYRVEQYLYKLSAEPGVEIDPNILSDIHDVCVELSDVPSA